MRGIASYLWQRRADFCGSVWRRVEALDLDAAVVANFWCGEWCGACLRICGGLTLGKHQTHDQDSVACLILGRGALGNKPNIPLVNWVYESCFYHVVHRAPIESLPTT
jgi:thiol-disulfide isomerase/thioredoxin